MLGKTPNRQGAQCLARRESICSLGHRISICDIVAVPQLLLCGGARVLHSPGLR